MDISFHSVPADTRAIIRTAGGGGWGDPLDRDPEKVYSDVLEDLVSIEAAKTEYGVVLHPGSEENVYVLDLKATLETRAHMKKKARGKN